MPKMIQVRNVPDDIHRTLKAQAALEGMSLSDYLLADLKRLASRPTRQQLLERLRSRPSVQLSLSPADAVRAERDSR